MVNPFGVVASSRPSGAALATSGHRSILRLALGLFVAALLSGCGYNRIQSADEGITQAWAEVVNQYQRRADLIPNLVNTV